MYKIILSEDQKTGNLIENVIIKKLDGGYTTFVNTESNNGPERNAYLEWLAEGNTPEIINEVE